MNDQHILKGTFEGFTFGPGKYRGFSAAPTVDLTMTSVHLNNHHVCDLVPVSKENRRCMSQHTHITTVELVYGQPFAD